MAYLTDGSEESTWSSILTLNSSDQEIPIILQGQYVEYTVAVVEHSMDLSLTLKRCFQDTTGQVHILTHNDCDNMHNERLIQTKFQHGRER